jgi:hypothetical protein
VFDDAQDVWESTFDRSGDAYDTAKLVLYSGAVRTDGCGGATSAVGPFYCPADERVYLDLSFYGRCAPTRRIGRLRVGLRDRPRNGPSRPADDRYERRRRAAEPL